MHDVWSFHFILLNFYKILLNFER
uniref:Uncharacterized protein n=1 Tax=Anguilla anguilla TaxID=7936 RepID=A0A0E9RZB8_ANGAN